MTETCEWCDRPLDEHVCDLPEDPPYEGDDE